MGKMFALTGLDSDAFTVNLKCEPARTRELREQYPEVRPGWHMNKKHWNTVDFEGSLEEEMLLELIDHSYELVVQKLPKKDRICLRKPLRFRNHQDQRQNPKIWTHHPAKSTFTS